MNMRDVVLGDIADISLGKMLDQRKNKGEYQPYLANVNVRWGGFDLDNLPQMRFLDSEEERYGLKYGDILVCEGGEPGRCAIWKDQIPNMKYQKALHRVRVHEKDVDFRWLFYRFLYAKSRGEFDQYFSGTTTIKHMPGEKIVKIKLALPDIKIQKRIGDILSSYDDLIENNQRQIKLLEEAAQRLYKKWFVDLHFPGFETTPIHDGIPEGWENKTLGEIADITMGQSPKSEFYNTERKGLPFHQGVGSYGNRFVLDEVFSTSYTKIAPAGSILFSVRAPVGRLNITQNKIVIGRGLAALNHKYGLQHFLFYMLKERFFKDNMIGNGSIFASISKDECMKQNFLIPSDSLVKRFDSFSSAYDRKIEVLENEIYLLKESRDRLLPKLMIEEMEI